MYRIAQGGVALLLLFSPFWGGLFSFGSQYLALLGAAVTAGILLLWKLRQQENDFFPHWYSVLLIALPLVYGLAAFQAADYGLAVNEIAKNLLYFLFFWSAAQVIRQEQDAKRALQLVYAAALGLAVTAFLGASGALPLTDAFLGNRLNGTFGYPNTLASYLAAGMLLGSWFWVNASREQPQPQPAGAARRQKKSTAAGNSRSWYWLYPTLAVGNYLLLAAFVGAGSRGGYLALGVILVGCWWFLDRESRRLWLQHLMGTATIGFLAGKQFVAAVAAQPALAWLWLVLGSLMAIGWQLALEHGFDFRRVQLPIKLPKLRFWLLGVGLLLMLGILLERGLAPEPGESLVSIGYLSSLIARLNFFKDAVAMFLQRPLLGWGGGGWEAAYQTFQSYQYISSEVHSYYLQVAVETGLLGLTVVIGLLGTGVVLSWRSLGKLAVEDPRRQRIWFVLMAVSLIILHAAIDFDFSYAAMTLLLWLLLAVLHLDWAKGSPIGGRGGNAAAIVLGGLIGIGLISSLALASADGCARLASRELQKGDGEKVERYIAAAAWLNPFDAGYQTSLMQVAMNDKRYVAAFDHAERAARLSRYNKERQWDLAALCLVVKDYPRAVEYALAALERSPWQVTSFERLAATRIQAAEAYLRAGRREAAAVQLTEVLAIPGAIERKLAGLSETEERMWRGERLLVTPQMRQATGEAHFLRGEWPAAMADFAIAAGDPALKEQVLLWQLAGAEKMADSELAAAYAQQLTMPREQAVPALDAIRSLPLL